MTTTNRPLLIHANYDNDEGEIQMFSLSQKYISSYIIYSSHHFKAQVITHC